MSSLRTAVQGFAATVAITLALRGQTLNVLHTFEQNQRGYQPQTGVIIGPGGSLYGTTPFGGVAGLGVVYEVAPPSAPGGTWTETVVHSFSSQNGDWQPNGGLVMGGSGVLYGVTNLSAYQLKPPSGSGTDWRESVLQVFSGTNGAGDNAKGSLTLGPNHSLYGATCAGGPAQYPNGIIFRLDPPAASGGAWIATVLYAFSAYLGDGACPIGGFAVSGDGTIYGVTQYGGANDGGTVFQLSPPTSRGGSWTETLLHSFSGQNGDAPLPNGVVIGPDGSLYGTAAGAYGKQCPYTGCGIVFQLSPPVQPGGAWTETILHAFGGDPSNDGTAPNSPLVFGPNGAFYGTTSSGGGRAVGPIGGTGTIFENGAALLSGRTLDRGDPARIHRRPGRQPPKRRHARPGWQPLRDDRARWTSPRYGVPIGASIALDDGGGTKWRRLRDHRAAIMLVEHTDQNLFASLLSFLAAQGVTDASLYGTEILGACTPFPPDNGQDNDVLAAVTAAMQNQQYVWRPAVWH